MSILQQLMPSLIGETGTIPFSYQTIFSILPKSFSKDAELLLKTKLRTVRTTKTPVLLHIGGIPGSGKTTFAKHLITSKQVPAGIANIQFDDIMENLPGYQHDKLQLVKKIGTKAGAKQAFLAWELLARIIGYEFLARAIDKKASILLDHSGACLAHVELLANIKKLCNYQVIMYFLQVDNALALKRALKRTKKTSRYLPPEYITERQLLLQKLLPKYIKLADILYMMDNSTNDALPTIQAQYVTGKKLI